MKKVAVGSMNPVKIEAVMLAFKTVWPDEQWLIEGIEVDSGVTIQPMNDEESIQGARNRAQRSLKTLQADFGVGLEGGLHQINSHWFDCGWVIVIDKKGNEGIGSTIRIAVPEKIMRMIHDGKELGDVCDIVFGGKNTKQAEGYFGLMTNNGLTRTNGFKDGVVSALATFVNPHLS